MLESATASSSRDNDKVYYTLFWNSKPFLFFHEHNFDFLLRDIFFNGFWVDEKRTVHKVDIE